MPSKLNTTTCAGWQHQLCSGYYQQVVMLLELGVKGAFYVSQKNVVDVLILLYFMELIQQQNQKRLITYPRESVENFLFQKLFNSYNEFPTKTTFPLGIVNFCINAPIFF